MNTIYIFLFFLGGTRLCKTAEKMSEFELTLEQLRKMNNGLVEYFNNYDRSLIESCECYCRNSRENHTNISNENSTSERTEFHAHDDVTDSVTDELNNRIDYLLQKLCVLESELLSMVNEEKLYGEDRLLSFEIELETNEDFSDENCTFNMEEATVDKEELLAFTDDTTSEQNDVISENGDIMDEGVLKSQEEESSHANSSRNSLLEQVEDKKNKQDKNPSWKVEQLNVNCQDLINFIESNEYDIIYDLMKKLKARNTEMLKIIHELQIK